MSNTQRFSNRPRGNSYRYQVRSCGIDYVCNEWEASATELVSTRLGTPQMSILGVAGQQHSVPASSPNYRLSWFPVEGAERYELQERILSSSLDTGFADLETNLLGGSYQSVDREGHATYGYQVRACVGADGTGEFCGDWSDSVLIEVALPSLQGFDLEQTVLVSGDMFSYTGNYDARWDDVGVSNIRYELQEKSGVSPWLDDDSQNVYTGTLTSSSISNSVSQSLVQYEYRVRACGSSGGCGSYTPAIGVSVGSAPAPQTLSLKNDSYTTGNRYGIRGEAGTNLTLRLQGDLSYTLVWPSVTGALAYQVGQSSDGITWSTVSMVNSPTVELSVTGASGSISYRVLSCTDLSCLSTSDPSNSPSLSVGLYDLTSPSLTITSSDETLSGGIYTSNDGAYTLSWNSDGILYDLQRKPSSISNWESLAPQTTGASYEELSISRNKYDHRVRACVGANLCGTWSNPLTVDVRVFPGGGSGSETDPYAIHNYEELKLIQEDLTAYYILANDVDATISWGEGSDSCTAYDGGGTVSSINPCAGWFPVGIFATGSRFTGSFDGQGYVISNLYSYRPSESHVGLFGVTEDATISRLTLSRVLIEGKLVGGLVGFAHNTVVSSIRIIRGLVKGSGDSAGGLIGNFVSGGSMRNVSSSVTVEGIDNVGGLIGYAEGNMINSSASGSVTGSGQYTGGLIGQHSSGIIVNSFGTGTVSGGILQVVLWEPLVLVL